MLVVLVMGEMTQSVGIIYSLSSEWQAPMSWTMTKGDPGSEKRWRWRRLSMREPDGHSSRCRHCRRLRSSLRNWWCWDDVGICEPWSIDFWRGGLVDGFEVTERQYLLVYSRETDGQSIVKRKQDGVADVLNHPSTALGKCQALTGSCASRSCVRYWKGKNVEKCI